jgi:hypothetical protein
MRSRNKQPTSLLVYPAPNKLVADRDAAKRGVRRFIGRAVDPVTNTYEITGEAVKVPKNADYLKLLRVGDLCAADEATALYAGVSIHTTPPLEWRDEFATDEYYQNLSKTSLTSKASQ